MSYSDFYELKMLDHMFNDPAYTPPATLYLALFTSAPTDAGPGAGEVSGGSYARLATTAADWDPAAAGSKSNGTDLSFPAATASWGTVTHWAVFDSDTGGSNNMLQWGALTASQVVDSGVTAKFSAGNLTTSLD